VLHKPGGGSWTHIGVFCPQKRVYSTTLAKITGLIGSFGEYGIGLKYFTKKIAELEKTPTQLALLEGKVTLDKRRYQE
jgi:hypothetical protein